MARSTMDPNRRLWLIANRPVLNVFITVNTSRGYLHSTRSIVGRFCLRLTRVTRFLRPSNIDDLFYYVKDNLMRFRLRMTMLTTDLFLLIVKAYRDRSYHRRSKRTQGRHTTCSFLCVRYLF